MLHKYVHGYSHEETIRLHDQAQTLNSLLHHDTLFPSGSKVLEAGCGIGAQTEIICRNNPDILLTSIDISEESLIRARQRCQKHGFTQVNFQQANIYDLPFEEKTFDHVFVCFVLEHLPDVNQALSDLKRLIKPGGGITVIEGDHGSAYFFPRSDAAQLTINCLIELQALDGGDSLIGRSLYPLLEANNFQEISVSPRMVYADQSKPDLVSGFTQKTFIAMVEGVKEKAIEHKLIAPAIWNKGIEKLKQSAGNDGVFCYTFFKANAIVK